MSFKIGKHIIGKDQPVYFIADIASNHNGDLEKAKALVHACAESGVNAIKMQNFTAETIVSDYGFKHLKGIETHQSQWQTSVFDSYDAASIPLDWTLELKSLSEKLGMDYFTSPYSPELAKAVAPQVSAFKLGSGDITWHEQIELMSGLGKPILIATGASDFEEVKMAVQVAQKHTAQIILMQCNTNYTARHGEEESMTKERFSNINLKVLQTYANQWPGMLLGLSDHTHGNLTVLAAVGLYDCVAVEKHFTLDSSQTGQDHAFSMMPKEWLNMVEKTRRLKQEIKPTDGFKERFKTIKSLAEDSQYLDLVLGDGIKQISLNEENTVVVQRRATRAKKDLKQGQKLKKEDLEFLRPCPKDAIPPYKFEELIGKALARDIAKGDYFKLSDVN
jgi:N-acetylneuraminate synthase